MTQTADTDPRLACVVLAAGQGTRMKSAHPKVLHRVAGRSMLGHVLDACAALAPSRLVVVAGPGQDAVRDEAAPWPTALQAERLGTGHAVRQAEEALAGAEGEILVVYGDGPLIRGESLAGLIRTHRRDGEAAITVMGARPAEPAGYGRLVTDGEGRLARIVEEKDATEIERTLDLCNTGVMVLDAARAWPLLAEIGCDNAKGEYYLTDIVGLARAAGLICGVREAADAAEFMGVNSRAELARAEAAMQTRLRAEAMAAGVTLTAPETVFLAHDTRIGADSVIAPHVTFGSGVEIGADARIESFCHIEGARIAEGARIGPFARLRPGTELGEQVRIGNFVETKAARLEAGAKANHLAYLGDAEIGAGANIGAGTITCNYDGQAKHRTQIGPQSFIGSNTALVAPLAIGAGAWIAAGSTITEDVPDHALGIARSRQTTKPGYAGRRRDDSATG